MKREKSILILKTECMKLAGDVIDLNVTLKKIAQIEHKLYKIYEKENKNIKVKHLISAISCYFEAGATGCATKLFKTLISYTLPPREWYLIKLVYIQQVTFKGRFPEAVEGAIKLRGINYLPDAEELYLEKKQKRRQKIFFMQKKFCK